MRSRRPLIPPSVVAVAAVSLLTAGCGGGASPGVVSVGSSTAAAATPQTGLLAYSHCMRSHGMPSFPDPDSSGEIPKDEVVPLVSSPEFQPASIACQDLLPNGSLGPSQQTAQQTATRVADGLSFARCMRIHGVTRFPDPTAHGDLTVAMLQAEGIDVRSPAVLRVVQACLPASHGALTPAKVAEALHRAGG